MRKRKTAKGTVSTLRQLNKLIEEATVDCYSREEQVSGFFTMIEQNLAVPFATRVLGVEVSVVGVEIDDDSGLKVVCKHGSERQRIGLTDLPLPSPPPRPAPNGSRPTGAGCAALGTGPRRRNRRVYTAFGAALPRSPGRKRVTPGR